MNLQLFAQEKTEEATPHRLQEVRRKGQIARSNDFSTSLVLLAGLLFLYWRRQNFIAGLAKLITRFLQVNQQQLLDAAVFINLAAYLLRELALLLAPLMALAVVIGTVVNFAQTGFVFSLHPIEPRLENLSPVNGFKRIFSRRALMELMKSLAKVTLVSLVVWQSVKGQFAQLLLTLDMGLAAAIELMAWMLFRVGLGTMAVFLLVGIVDYVFQRREYMRNIRMSKQEVKEEMKQMEGDPMVRSRLREKQRQLARHRMMHAVPEATVVIVNPAHIAVALRYREEEGAPRVVAKGVGGIAKRIQEIARRHKVPIVREPPIARALFYQVELGQEIPVALYQVVAEILAQIYRKTGGL